MADLNYSWTKLICAVVAINAALVTVSIVHRQLTAAEVETNQLSDRTQESQSVATQEVQPKVSPEEVIGAVVVDASSGRTTKQIMDPQEALKSIPAPELSVIENRDISDDDPLMAELRKAASQTFSNLLNDQAALPPSKAPSVDSSASSGPSEVATKLKLIQARMATMRELSNAVSSLTELSSAMEAAGQHEQAGEILRSAQLLEETMRQLLRTR